MQADRVPLPTASPVKQMGLGVSIKATSTVLAEGGEECVLFTSLAQILSGCMGIWTTYIWVRNISLTFWLQNKIFEGEGPKLGPDLSI